jgi:hypothetical protein
MCPIHLENKFFNDHILIRVIQSPLKWFANVLRVSKEPLGEIQFEKNGKKKRKEGVEIFKEPLSGVEIS